MPSKSKLGQNFLRDDQAIGRIVAALGDCSDRTVVEIGPGTGAITRELAAKAGKVLALEYDRELASRLTAELSGGPAQQGAVSVQSKVEVITIDVLSFDFAAAAAAANQRLIVVGNLPYYITSPILLRLAEYADVLDRAVLMVQREVADRVAGVPGSRDYGLLSVAVQMHGPVEPLFTLPPSAFSPPPEVYSTVFRWRFAPRFKELEVDRKPFLKFLRQIFAAKRKTLANNLRAAGVDPSMVADALSKADIDLKARAEAVSVESLAALWRILKTNGATPKNEVAPLIDLS
ncbi:16S rRNA (adenine(1518)-N(6)/adenine(1519)-N(6))-dimethyltransferase RsmA [Telmatobacter sp. DSM 110680]|uniref:Ribosomal RNA small subunit methyltransferase A n=1 Tax=Telmatobacter sp. DSM 110680 TaxID=3036704 RepID=A0AAU7DH00_9BACT